jgi:hypothetical protein
MEQAWEKQSINMLQHEVYHVLVDDTRSPSLKPS